MVKSLPARILTMDIRAFPMGIHALAMDLGTVSSTWDCVLSPVLLTAYFFEDLNAEEGK